MAVLQDTTNSDGEMLTLAMTVVNKMLRGFPDQVRY